MAFIKCGNVSGFTVAPAALAGAEPGAFDQARPRRLSPPRDLPLDTRAKDVRPRAGSDLEQAPGAQGHLDLRRTAAARVSNGGPRGLAAEVEVEVESSHHRQPQPAPDTAPAAPPRWSCWSPAPPPPAAPAALDVDAHLLLRTLVLQNATPVATSQRVGCA
jgi:hypothetical protein